MDPIVTKAVTSTISDPSNGIATPFPKDGASQFDKIKLQLQDTADKVNSYAPQSVPSTAAMLPTSAASAQPSSAAVQPANPGSKSATEIVRSTNINSLPPASEKVQQAMVAGRYHLDRLEATVKANSSASTMDKVKGKLTSIEAQYNQLDGTLQQISPNASPQDWLRLQQMANSMNENISVLSKLVDSASSGVKTILQTQI